MLKMLKMSLIITDIAEEELEFFKKQYLNAGDLLENIEILSLKEPKDKRKKEWKEWQEKISFLHYLYNAKVGWKAFSINGDFKGKFQKLNKQGVVEDKPFEDVRKRNKKKRNS
jgi:hypothetical protein